MERASVENPEKLGAASEVAHLAPALGTDRVAVNRYRLAPSEGFPSGLHAHADQEEVFVVFEGSAVFETCPSPVADESGETGELRVDEGEGVRFAPGEFQSGRNAGDAALVALALGAPRDSTDVRVPFACPDCGDASLALDFEDEFGFACPVCGAERTPADCPACGHDDLRATLNDAGGVVAACAACERAYDHPPVVGEW